MFYTEKNTQCCLIRNFLKRSIFSLFFHSNFVHSIMIIDIVNWIKPLLECSPTHSGFFLDGYKKRNLIAVVFLTITFFKLKLLRTFEKIIIKSKLTAKIDTHLFFSVWAVGANWSVSQCWGWDAFCSLRPSVWMGTEGSEPPVWQRGGFSTVFTQQPLYWH